MRFCRVDCLPSHLGVARYAFTETVSILHDKKRIIRPESNDRFGLNLRQFGIRIIFTNIRKHPL